MSLTSIQPHTLLNAYLISHVLILSVQATRQKLLVYSKDIDLFTSVPLVKSNSLFDPVSCFRPSMVQIVPSLPLVSSFLTTRSFVP